MDSGEAAMHAPEQEARPWLNWQKTPAALLRTSAPFPAAKSVVFAACSGGYVR
jgi:hypothetical protein